MSFNEDELRKIERATSGLLKKKARAAIAQSIRTWRPRIENAKPLPEARRMEELKRLVNEATAARQRALKNGANSHGHPEWAAAAVCESWLHELLGGSAESISRVEAFIDKLERR
ncbi:MAG: hypothetical protein RBT51_05695 [Ectothiorhodospiraceae bacterium]|jgi:hypothetical protein|nr:hypothetical protein [Ectothiorhodospiraceae bacterium]